MHSKSLQTLIRPKLRKIDPVAKGKHTKAFVKPRKYVHKSK
jgi:hypothetical protein